MKKMVIGGVIAAMVATSSALAGEIDLDIYGISYALDKSGADKEAKRKIDDDGQWTFNPGLGLTYDFRENAEAKGWSPFVVAGWLQDSSDEPVYFAGGGARYRNYFGSSNWMWEVNAGGIIANAEDWDEEDRETTVLPIASLGVGYKFSQKHLLKANFYYMPEDNDISATGETDLIFMQVSYSF